MNDFKESNTQLAMKEPPAAAESNVSEWPARFLAQYNTERQVIKVLGDQYSEMHLTDVFPRILEMGQLSSKEQYYTVIASSSDRFEPVALQLLEVDRQKYLQVNLLVTEAAWLQRRQYLMARFAARSWHYMANLSTAGMGYLAYLQNQQEQVPSKQVLQGVEKSFRSVQDSARLVCALVRQFDPAREQPLFNLTPMVARFAEGIFLPDLQIEWIEELGNPGIAVKETPFAHLLLELFIMTYTQGCRRISVRPSGSLALEISLDRTVECVNTTAWSVITTLAERFQATVLLNSPSEISLLLK